MSPSFDIDEEQRVEAWNLSLFCKQGFDGPAVATLLSWGVSPHETDRLVKAGCPLDLVLGIVAPLDEQPEPESAHLADRLAPYSVR